MAYLSPIGSSGIHRVGTAWMLVVWADFFARMLVVWSEDILIFWLFHCASSSIKYNLHGDYGRPIFHSNDEAHIAQIDGPASDTTQWYRTIAWRSSVQDYSCYMVALQLD